MEPIVLVSNHGHRIAFKISSAKVMTLDHFIKTWAMGTYPKVYVTYMNASDDCKPHALSAALIKKEFPEYIDSDYYRSINY